MTKEGLFELIKNSSPWIIYVVDERNKLIKLNTPFKLLVLQEIGELRIREVVYCTELKITDKGRIVFCIGDKFYHPRYFDFLTE